MRKVYGLVEATKLLARNPGSRSRAGIHMDSQSEHVSNTENIVARILDDVRRDGDRALRDWTSQLDGIQLAELEVPQAALDASLEAMPQELRDALHKAADRIRDFHTRSLPRTWLDFKDGSVLGQMVVPIDRVGIYAPGGRAKYPSSILMQAVPAKVAGVSEIIVTSPPAADGIPAPVTLAACKIAGVDRVFALGGAQAIAALAYGTETVPAVDKIVGPGNIFVATAKQMVYGTVAIDQIAGPTETLIIADDAANPNHVALDMIAQAEHDPRASAVLVTDSEAFADTCLAEISRWVAQVSTGETAAAALANNGIIAILDSLDDAVDLANLYAPEHLCLEIRDPWSLLPRVRHAGGVFLGRATPEAMGDYIAGPSHVMPTSGTARFSSPGSTQDFVKITSVVSLSGQDLAELGPLASLIAEAEGLDAHALAISERLRNE